MSTYADLLHERFPQDKATTDFMMKHGCPHWFFDVPYNKDCMFDNCKSCWEREANRFTPIK